MSALAQPGARVYIASRSRAKGEAAVAQIRAATGNDAVFFLPLDLADLGSVRAAAAAFLALDEPLHVLVNNAGVAGRRGLTRQGFELMFGVNHALTGLPSFGTVTSGLKVLQKIAAAGDDQQNGPR